LFFKFPKKENNFLDFDFLYLNFGRKTFLKKGRKYFWSFGLKEKLLNKELKENIFLDF